MHVIKHWLYLSLTIFNKWYYFKVSEKNTQYRILKMYALINGIAHIISLIRREQHPINCTQVIPSLSHIKLILYVIFIEFSRSEGKSLIKIAKTTFVLHTFENIMLLFYEPLIFFLFRSFKHQNGIDLCNNEFVIVKTFFLL